MADATVIRLECGDNAMRVFLDGRDVTEEIRNPDVTRSVSAVSAVKRVREAMVREQRRMGERGGIVVEGRDIGTIVFPHADLKFFMVANVDERAKRRNAELKEKGLSVSLEQLKEEIIERDQKDSAREFSPLRKAADAIVIDTSTVTIDEQVERIVREAEARRRPGP
jgi:cytidylate kinase